MGTTNILYAKIYVREYFFSVFFGNAKFKTLTPVESTTKTQTNTGNSQAINEFSRAESSTKQNTINDRKSKSVSKVETMIAEMSIKIMRYQVSAKISYINILQKYKKN